MNFLELVLIRASLAVLSKCHRPTPYFKYLPFRSHPELLNSVLTNHRGVRSLLIARKYLSPGGSAVVSVQKEMQDPLKLATSDD